MRFFVVVLFAVGALIVGGSLTFGCSHEHDDDHADGHAHGGEGGADGSDPEGVRMCCEISAVCHEVSEPSSAEAAKCHNISHGSDPGACRSAYEDCLATCEGLNESPVEHSCE